MLAPAVAGYLSRIASSPTLCTPQCTISIRVQYTTGGPWLVALASAAGNYRNPAPALAVLQEIANFKECGTPRGAMSYKDFFDGMRLSFVRPSKMPGSYPIPRMAMCIQFLPFPPTCTTEPAWFHSIQTLDCHVSFVDMQPHSKPFPIFAKVRRWLCLGPSGTVLQSCAL
jgi:hypothetical protein